MRTQVLIAIFALAIAVTTAIPNKPILPVFISPVEKRPRDPQALLDSCARSCEGPDRECRILEEKDGPSCVCKSEYVGNPPHCRSKCTENSNCADDLACVRGYCADPCRGLCGINAYCTISNHIATCNCPENMIGDPLKKCETMKDKKDVPVIAKSDCSKNSDCADEMACFKNQCIDPCPGICGSNAYCTVSKHVPACNCAPSMWGNPFEACMARLNPVPLLPRLPPPPTRPPPTPPPPRVA